MPNARLSIDINAPADVIFGIVTDFAHYPEIFPEVQRIDVEQQSKTKARAVFHVNIVKRFKYTLGFTFKAPSRVGWAMLEGEFLRKNTGTWEIAPLNKKTTHVTYALELGFPPLVPAMVTQLLVESTLPGMLGRLKKKAERLAKS